MYESSVPVARVDEKWRQFWRLLTIYAASFVTALLLALAFFFPPDPHAMPPAPPADINARLARIEALLEHGTHGKHDIDAVTLKMMLVGSLAVLWFSAFSAASAYGFWREECKRHAARSRDASDAAPPDTGPGAARWRIPAESMKYVLGVPALIPLVIFTFAMSDVYEPAVFVMALVAIYIAAEHYGGLVATENKLDATGEDLRNRASDLSELVGRVLDADGLASWRTEVYEMYSRATRRVDAVIRYFDIDPEWWQCGRGQKPWAQYGAIAASGTGTLLSALMACQAKVQFIGHMPLPLFDGNATSVNQKGVFFRNFLGLAWQLVVFDMVRERRASSPGGLADSPGLDDTCDPAPATARPRYLRVRIAQAASWMHVIDRNVFQVIERGSDGNSTVRELTRSMRDPKARRTLSGWARSNVRHFAHRGSSAEEYVFSTLRHAALCLDDGFVEHQSIDPLALERLLNGLGLQEFIEMPKPDFLLNARVNPHREPGLAEGAGDAAHRPTVLDSNIARKLCVEVFTELVHRRVAARAGTLLASRSQSGPHLCDLAYESL
ncbi:hypothetical protein OU994_13770 [Pseudoduganella sp. SL102]|uniref:hypothetical protein n=1 Tax=Pseudoduganella sp. SL102 TaxID=2995154 RepID=UPI00248B64D1|nr:hypothetical protein [Pseudoduganella sp. SL102]WBS05269.1 hypothetical protein OU994_13770 [Pseudoduganella sp. SL102]